MDLGSAAKVLLRRWLVVLVGALLTVGGAAYLYSSTPPSYQASARMLLLLPNNARGPDQIGSPFLYLPSGLEVIARLVAGAPATRVFQESKAAAGHGSDATVSVDSSSPMLIVEVSGLDPEDVLVTRDWVVETLQAELNQIQLEEGAPSSQIAHARVFGAEDVPRSGGNTWMRPVLAVAAAGGVITLVAAFGIDYLLRRRRTRKLQRDAAPSDESVEPGESPLDQPEAAEDDAITATP